MVTKYKVVMLLSVLLGWLLTACSPEAKFAAPKIGAPADLTPGYVPEGFELGFGFQLPGGIKIPTISDGNGLPALTRLHIIDLKSPDDNDIQGVYYRGKDQLLLITKSYFPGGTLDTWQTTYEASQPKPCECECSELRLNGISLPVRLYEIQEKRTIEGKQVAILKGPMGWLTVFVRGDYLLTVESGISLEENLKVVASLTSE